MGALRTMPVTGVMVIAVLNAIRALFTKRLHI